MSIIKTGPYRFCAITIFFLFQISCQSMNQSVCTVGYGEYGPLQYILDGSKVSTLNKLRQTKFKKNLIKETLQLGENKNVLITQSGCSHHTTEYIFSGFGISKSKNDLEQAIEFLEKIKTFSDNYIEDFITVLSRLKSENLDLTSFNCAESICSISTENGNFKIIQDFPI